MTIKAQCEVCGTVLRVIRTRNDLLGLPTLCDECRVIVEAWKWKTREIGTAISDVAAALRVKGDALRTEVAAFEEKLVTTFITAGERVLSERFKAIEKGIGKEVKTDGR